MFSEHEVLALPNYIEILNVRDEPLTSHIVLTGTFVSTSRVVKYNIDIFVIYETIRRRKT